MAFGVFWAEKNILLSESGFWAYRATWFRSIDFACYEKRVLHFIFYHPKIIEVGQYFLPAAAVRQCNFLEWLNNGIS